ncbi:MAG: RDD family protein [Flavobacteriaceae bacterium]
MDEFQIETAQNISINQHVANLGTRIGAYLLDFLIIMSYVIVVFYIINSLNIMKGFDLNLTYTLLMLPVFFYSLLFETLFNGQSPGKMLTNIRVVKKDGSKPTFGSFLMRWVLRIIDVQLASGAVAIFTILLNGKGQRLGDLAAGTTVITERHKISLKNTLLTDLEVDYKPTYSQVTLLSDSDIQTIKNLYQKSVRRGNHNIILRLYDKIIKITDIKTEQKPFEFVETVIKDYNYFTQNG